MENNLLNDSELQEVTGGGAAQTNEIIVSGLFNCGKCGENKTTARKKGSTYYCPDCGGFMLKLPDLPF